MATEAEIATLKAKMESAYAQIAPAYSSMNSWYQLMTKCKIKNDEDKYLVLGEQATGKCQTGSENNHPGCADAETCRGNMSKYNTSVVNWENANSNYENARDDYNDAIGGKGEEDISKIEQEAKAIRTRYYVFGGIVLVVIVAGIFIWMKLRK